MYTSRVCCVVVFFPPVCEPWIGCWLCVHSMADLWRVLGRSCGAAAAICLICSLVFFTAVVSVHYLFFRLEKLFFRSMCFLR